MPSRDCQIHIPIQRLTLNFITTSTLKQASLLADGVFVGLFLRHCHIQIRATPGGQLATPRPHGIRALR